MASSSRALITVLEHFQSHQLALLHVEPQGLGGVLMGDVEHDGHPAVSQRRHRCAQGGEGQPGLRSGCSGSKCLGE